MINVFLLTLDIVMKLKMLLCSINKLNGNTNGRTF